MSKLIVKSSPHILGRRTTQRIMLDVVVALLPTLLMSCYIFGLRALLLTAVSVASCVGFEYLFRLVTKRDNSITDCSAVVTGMLLAFCVPVTLPVPILVFGAFMAIVVTKQLFGGIGQNFANPAITGRIIMQVSFVTAMSNSWGIPTLNSDYSVSLVAGATPLEPLVSGATGSLPGLLQMFFGFRGGCIGETCAFTLILGGIYLYLRKNITLTAPLTYMAGIAVIALLAGQNPAYHLLSGGVMLAAIYMISDYSTTPVTEKGRFIFALGCACITMIIRLFGEYPDGVSFAILLMNVLTPYIGKMSRTKPLGGVKA